MSAARTTTESASPLEKSVKLTWDIRGMAHASPAAVPAGCPIGQFGVAHHGHQQ
jgi:hypothetical protein